MEYLSGQSSLGNMYVRTKAAFAFKINVFCTPSECIKNKVAFLIATILLFHDFMVPEAGNYYNVPQPNALFCQQVNSSKNVM